MTLWGVFDKRAAIHVCPCDNDGYKAKDHELTIECPCHPMTEYVPTEKDRQFVVIHRIPQNVA